MPNIKRIDGKTGPAFKITVTQGRDLTGKQVRHYRTWTPAPGMTERQMDKAAQKAALDFEREIELGYQTDNRQTFAEYAEYVIALKERTGVKPETISTYHILKQRIDPKIGHIKLVDLRPQHLNQLYTGLSQEGQRKGGDKARARVDVSALMKKKGLTQTALAERAGISTTSLREFCGGGAMRPEKAHNIAQQLGVADRDLFRVERDMTPLSPKTVLEHHRFISTVLSQAEKEMFVPYNAASKATPPKRVKKEVNYFQPEDLVKILDALEAEPIKWRTITHLLLVTGVRRGEIMGLRWDRVDLDSGRITIDSNLLYNPDRGVYEGSTKAGTVRYVPVPSDTVALLKKYRAWCNELRLKVGDLWKGENDGLLFVRDDGKPMNPDSITAWLLEFSKRHDLPHINPHAFRHSAASILIDSGADLLAVSKQLGHTMASTTTDIYGHMIAKAAERNRDCIAEVLLNRPG